MFTHSEATEFITAKQSLMFKLIKYEMKTMYKKVKNDRERQIEFEVSKKKKKQWKIFNQKNDINNAVNKLWITNILISKSK